VSILSIFVALLAVTLGPIASTSAQDASAAASPEATAGCTANLGLVRSTKACVAIVHASPDAPAVDVYLNGEVAVTALVPGSATPFLELPAGDYLVQVVPAGGTVEEALITVDPLTIVAARAYEVVALGVVAPSGSSSEIEAAAEIRGVVFDVTTYAVPSSGADLPRSWVRIVHAIPYGKAIDAALIAGDVAMPLAEDLEFGSAGDYLESPAGTYRLTVSATWGENLLDEPAVEIAPDAATTVYVVMGATGTTRLDLLVVTTAAARLPAPEATTAATPTA